MNFIMQRDFVVATLRGHSIEFKKGVSTHVPDHCWADVQQHGAVPETDLPAPDPSIPVIPQGEARRAAILKAMRAVVLRNERDDFTAGGAPHNAVVSGQVGFKVDAAERDEAWIELQRAE